MQTFLVTLKHLLAGPGAGTACAATPHALEHGPCIRSARVLGLGALACFAASLAKADLPDAATLQHHLADLASVSEWQPEKTPATSAQNFTSNVDGPAGARFMKLGAAYWAKEALEGDSFVGEGHAELLVSFLRDEAFAESLFTALESQAAEFPEIHRLRNATALLHSALVDGRHYSFAIEVTEQVRMQQIAALDIMGRYRTALKSAIDLLNAIREPGRGTTAHAVLTRQVLEHVGRVRDAAGEEIRSQLKMLRSLGTTYVGVDREGNESIAPLGAEIERQMDLDTESDQLFAEAFPAAFGPRCDLNGFLNGPARAYALKRQESDCAALILGWQHRDNRKLHRTLLGLNDLPLVARRLGATASAGPAVGRFQCLIELGYHFIAATDWFDLLDRLDEKKLLIGLRLQAGKTVDRLNSYRDRWVSSGTLPGALYAAIETDELGKPRWRMGAWLRWEWMSEQDLSEARIDGRIFEREGRTWLMPGGIGKDDVQHYSDRDLVGNGGREVILAIDPKADWTK